jgi:hypothetical protein
VQYDPLVMPTNESLGFGKRIGKLQQSSLLLEEWIVRIPTLQPINYRIMKLEERKLQLRNNDILIVARVGNDSNILAVAGKVVLGGWIGRIQFLNEELGSTRGNIV